MTSFNIEKSIGFLLAKTQQRLFAIFREELIPFGLTPPQFVLLAFLWKQDNLSQAELSKITEVDRTTLGGMIDRLEKLALVTRGNDPSDRRAWLIQLTERGKALEKDLGAMALRVRRKFFSPLTEDETNQLSNLLKKLGSR